MQELNSPKMEGVLGPASAVSTLSEPQGQWILNQHSLAATMASSDAKAVCTQDNTDSAPACIHHGLDSAHCPELACSQTSNFQHSSTAPSEITQPSSKETASSSQIAERLSSAHHELHGILLHQSVIGHGRAASLTHPDAATEAATDVPPKDPPSTLPPCFANNSLLHKPAEHHGEASEHQKACTHTLTSCMPDQSTQKSPALPAVQSQDNLNDKTPEQTPAEVPSANLHKPPPAPVKPFTEPTLQSPDPVTPHSDKAASACDIQPVATSPRLSSSSLVKVDDQPDVANNHPHNHPEAALSVPSELAVLESIPTPIATEFAEVHPAGNEAPSEPAQLDFAAYASYLAATQQQRESILQSPKLQRAMAPAGAKSGDADGAQLSDSPFSGMLCACPRTC